MASPEEIIASIKDMAFVTPRTGGEDSVTFTRGFNAALRAVREVIEFGEHCAGDCNEGYGPCEQCAKAAAPDAR